MSDKQEEMKESQEAPRSEAADLRDQLLRLKADFDNTRKRLEREKQESIKYANEGLLIEILPIADNLDRALESLAQGHDPAKVQEGLRIAQNELHEVLKECGVQVVKSVGTEFDPRFHEAIGVVETSDAKDGWVVEEVQRGYLLNGRLVRPSRVKVAKHSS